MSIPMPLLIALWAFMRAHPEADFDAFVKAGFRAAALMARERGDA